MQVNVNKVKITTTVPPKHLNKVREAMFENGAGIIGDYTHCSYSSKVVGTFKPNEKANPFIGKANKLEFVDEYKLELVCDIEKVKMVLDGLRKAHPYEEPAIEIQPLIDESQFE